MTEEMRPWFYSINLLDKPNEKYSCRSGIYYTNDTGNDLFLSLSYRIVEIERTRGRTIVSNDIHFLALNRAD
jgi:hypothetical protein